MVAIRRPMSSATAQGRILGKPPGLGPVLSTRRLGRGERRPADAPTEHRAALQQPAVAPGDAAKIRELFARERRRNDLAPPAAKLAGGIQSAAVAFVGHGMR